MADYGSLNSPTDNYRKASRLLTGLAGKGFPDTECIMSPTSILDTKPFTAFRNPFWSDSNSNTPKSPKPLDSKGVGVGLGLVDALIDDSKELNSVSRMVVFGSQLKIQIPNVVSPIDSPPSPRDFGIKSRNSFTSGFCYPSPMKKSPFGSSPGTFSSLSAAEMELSEDYTCVISHGPNPRTTHIFDDCIVESCCGVVASRKEIEPPFPSHTFLSFCQTCNKNLDVGKEIYMYRGEKAFCSSDCRYKEMMLEQEIDNKPETDDVYCGIIS